MFSFRLNAFRSAARRQGRTLVTAVLSSLFALSCSEKPRELVIGVIPKGEQHVFWSNVRVGAQEGAASYGVNGSRTSVTVCWRPPVIDDDVERQIDQVRLLSNPWNPLKRVSGLILAPLDAQALFLPVWSAHNQLKVPVLIMDSGLGGVAGKDFVRIVETDNYQAGRMAADQAIEVLDQVSTCGREGHDQESKQSVDNRAKRTSFWIFPYRSGSGSTTLREQGFINGIRESFPNAETGRLPYGGANARKAKEVATCFFLCSPDQPRDCDEDHFTGCEKFKEQYERGDKILLFAPNESTSEGLMLALNKLNRGGKRRPRMIGFDLTEKLEEGLFNGLVSALVVQNPRAIGKESVVRLVEKLNGENAATSPIYIPARVFTEADFLSSDASQYLSADPDQSRGESQEERCAMF